MLSINNHSSQPTAFSLANAAWDGVNPHCHESLLLIHVQPAVHQDLCIFSCSGGPSQLFHKQCWRLGWFCARYWALVFALITFHKVLGVFLQLVIFSEWQLQHPFVFMKHSTSLSPVSFLTVCSVVQMVEDDMYVGADDIPGESSSTCNWPPGSFETTDHYS